VRPGKEDSVTRSIGTRRNVEWREDVKTVGPIPHDPKRIANRTPVRGERTPTAAAERPSLSLPVNVLFLDHTAAESGGEIALLNLVRHLDPRKVKPIVVFGAEGPIVEKMSPFADTRVLPLPAVVGGTRKDALGFASLLRVRAALIALIYVWHLVFFIRRNNVDIVHTNSLKADLLGGIAGRLSRRLVVWHIRDRIDDDYLPRSVVRAFRILSRWIPHFLIANSQATLRSLHLPPSQSSTSIPSGIYFDRQRSVVHDGTHARIQSNRGAEPGGIFQVGLIGRICPWKGQHIFLRAAALVHKRFPNARFVIVGSALFGEVEYGREVRLLPKHLGIADLVTFTGFRSDVPEIISEMDLIVHASTTGEPFGQVIIEGMAAGKPVIATNGGGVPEIVEDGKTGILVPMGDVQAMAAAICRVLADPALARDMGIRGRKRVRDYFTIEQTARKVEAIYQQMISPS